MTTNDNNPDRGRDSPLPSPDAHGQAALLLVESLIHGLCENTVLSPNGAVEIAERAVDVQSAQAREAEGESASMWRSYELLSLIASSLRLDDRGGSSLPREVS